MVAAPLGHIAPPSVRIWNFLGSKIRGLILQSKFVTISTVDYSDYSSMWLINMDYLDQWCPETSFLKSLLKHFLHDAHWLFNGDLSFSQLLGRGQLCSCCSSHLFLWIAWNMSGKKKLKAPREGISHTQLLYCSTFDGNNMHKQFSRIHSVSHSIFKAALGETALGHRVTKCKDTSQLSPVILYVFICSWLL